MNRYLINGQLSNSTVCKRALTLVLILFVGACASTGSNPVPPQAAAAGDSSARSIYQTTVPVSENWLSAQRQLRAEIAADSGSVDAHLRLAVLYRKMEKFNQAGQAVSTAMQLSNGAVHVQNEMGILHRSQGQFERAKKTYESILKIDPDYANAHFNLGILYDLYLREPGLAHAHYEAYLKSAPQADVRVEKWLVDLQRRYGIDTNTSMVQVSE